MVKHILKPFLVFLFLVALPFLGYCQLPVPKWVDDLGGSGDSKPTGMITDKQNNIYISGYFEGTVDFDPSSGVKNLTSVGGYDIYVAKYNSDGTLVWAVSMGGNALDQVNAMTVDNNGNPTIIGQYQSSTLTAGSLTFQNAGGDDIFIIHLDTNGNILWGKSLGGSDTDRGEEVSADAQGNVIATCIAQSAFTLNGKQITAQGAFSALIIKYDAAGNFLWDVDITNSSDNEIYGNGIDSQGNIVVSGSYSGTVDFDPNGAHHSISSNGQNNPFLAKYTPAGNLIWVDPIVGSLVYNGSALSIDPNDNIYLTGAFSSSLVFNSNFTLNLSGYQDTFLAKYSSGGIFQYAKDIGGSGAGSFPYQIRTDQTDNVYITGYFTGTIDFNPDPTATAFVSYHGQRDFFLTKYNTNGNYQWAFSGGSSNCDNTFGIELAVDNTNAVVLGGAFCQTVNFDPSTCSTLNVTAQNGQSDSFIAKYIQSTTAVTQITAFTIPQQTSPAVIDQTALTVSIKVAPGSNIKSLVPTITTSAGILSPASAVAEDFTSPFVYTITNGCATVKYTVTVTELALQTLTICSGVNNTLTGDSENPVPGSYTWQVLQNGNWINAPGVIANKDYQTSALLNSTAANITFSLRRQITTQGVLSYDSFYDVTVQPVSAITNNSITAPATTAFCQSGDPALINGSTPSGGSGTYTYQWQSSADNVTFTDIAGATAQNFDPPVAISNINYRRTVSSGSCNVATESNVVAITVIPAVSNNTITAPAITAFCSTGDPGNITGSTPTGGTGNYTYQWQSSADNTSFTDIAGATAINYDPSAIAATTYYRRSVISGACNVPLVSNVVTITVTGTPAAPVLAVSPVAICADNTATLSISSPQQGITYDWYSSPAKTNHLFTGAQYVTGVLNASASYYVEASNGSCSSALTSVAVNVSPVPASPAITGPGNVCEGSVASLTIQNPQAGLTYNWYTTASGGTRVFTGADFVTAALTTGTTYYADATNGSGCVSVNRTAVSITVSPLPIVTGTNASICPGLTAALQATSTDQQANITWYSSASGGSVIFTGTNFTTPVLNSNTTYYAEATDKVTGCISSAHIPVSVTILQQLAAPVVSAGTITASSITFNWDAVPGATGYEVSVDNGQTFTAPSSGANGLSNTITNLQSGQSVTIIVRATGSSSCQLSTSSTAVTAIAVNPLANQIYVPNAFTPNGDGKNDVVYAHSESIKSLKFYIYDQWGELLFSSLNQANGWDGTYKGTKEPVGVYVYYLVAIMDDGQTVNKKGTITLLR